MSMRGRPRKAQKSCIVFGVNIPVTQEHQLRELAKSNFTMRNQMVRRAIDRFLKEEQIKNLA